VTADPPPGPDGSALFRSATIGGGGATAPVAGTQYLTTGSYPFTCTIHPTEMHGTLQVTGNGTPQARPSLRLAVTSKKLAKVRKMGLLVQVDTSVKVDGVDLVAKLGKVTLGRRPACRWRRGSSSRW